MRINEGNIFEAMRLALPEHRGVMEDWHRQRSTRAAPTLMEDEFETMQQTLSEAIAGKLRVRLTLFGEQSNTVVTGIPVYDGRLRLDTDKGLITVDTQRLLGVEVC